MKKYVVIFAVRHCYIWVPILNRQVCICSYRYTKFFTWKLRINYFYCIKITPLSTDTSTHYIWYHSHHFFLLFKTEEKHSGRNTEFSGNGLHYPAMERQTSVHYHGETKGQKQTKKPNSKDHLLAKRTPAEVLKPQCGFISQCGLRKKQHFQGDNSKVQQIHSKIHSPLQFSLCRHTCTCTKE